LTQKAPYKGLGAESEEKREPVSDIDTGVVDTLKALDPRRPIREGHFLTAAYCHEPHQHDYCDHLVSEAAQLRS